MRASRPYQAWSWFILSLVISCGNDVLVKTLGMDLPGIEISFLRFFWAAILLIVLFPGHVSRSFLTTDHKIHLGRSIFLFIGMGIWTSLLLVVPLSQATIINFTIPLITMILGKYFLDEKISTRQYQATALGVIGILMTLEITSSTVSWSAIGLLLGAICFASCDVFNKVSGRDDALIPTLFYTAVYTAALSAPFAYSQWAMPSSSDLLMTLVLGMNANILFYCLLKAFQQLKLSQVASLRYLELVLSIGAGFIFFEEIPALYMLAGGLLVILGATLAITESEPSVASPTMDLATSQ